MPKDGLTKHLETRLEEIVNTITHGIGTLLAIAGLVVLVMLAKATGDTVRVVTLSVFGGCLVLTYLASTLYHALPIGRWKYRALILDHASIYLLIAGTYTPVLLITLYGSWGWTLFAIIWITAAIGVVLKLFFVERFRLLSTMMYLAMGWMLVVAVKPMLAVMPAGGWAWLLAGGLAYSGGVIFFLWERLPFNHAIWHLFVIAGSVCHFLMILWYVLPQAA
ncbi:MAG TPA: hemolysin III family protein [Tepidisphaeraceae bacterium]|nr:hemolysin III family protein [Tepidisphaeraceae bacterium]